MPKTTSALSVVALISAREIVADNIKGNAKSPLEAVIITGETDRTS
ncbi:MAG: hypothetical protein ACJ8EF_17390 [Bradyrhizobium sp.]